MILWINIIYLLHTIFYITVYHLKVRILPCDKQIRNQGIDIKNSMIQLTIVHFKEHWLYDTKRQVELVWKKFCYTMYDLLHKWQWLRSALCLSSDFIKKLNHNLLSWRLITVQLHVAINMAEVLIQWTGWAFHPRKSLCNLNFVHAKFPLLEGTAKSWGSNCWCLVVKCHKK